MNLFIQKKLGQGGLAGVGLASWLKLQGPM